MEGALTMEWNSTLQEIRKKFPKAPQLSIEELVSWLQDPGVAAPALLDVRAPKEFQVSHLKGARLAPEGLRSRAELGVPKELPLVFYCSVGYRSSRVAERLFLRGDAFVWSLEGSIFAWANAGHEVFQGAQEVRKVHPFDKKWGALLESSLWSWG